MDYDALQKEVEDMGQAILSWNLKYDPFPNIKEWVKENWTAPYGADVAERYLYACADARADGYHGNTKYSSEKNDAYKSLRGIIMDLKGDTLSPARTASALRRMASAIDNSKIPSRELVARDLSNLITRLSSKGFEFDSSIVPLEYGYLYNDLGFVDMLNRREDLTEDELVQIMDLEDLAKKAHRYFSKNSNEYMYYRGKDYTRKTVYDHIKSVVLPIWKSVRQRHAVKCRNL